MTRWKRVSNGAAFDLPNGVAKTVDDSGDTIGIAKCDCQNVALHASEIRACGSAGQNRNAL